MTTSFSLFFTCGSRRTSLAIARPRGQSTTSWRSAGEALVIVGPVDPGSAAFVSVPFSSSFRSEARRGLKGPRSQRVEHQVLEEVREAGLAWLLVPRAPRGTRCDSSRRRALASSSTSDREAVAQLPAVELLVTEGVGPLVRQSPTGGCFSVRVVGPRMPGRGRVVGLRFAHHWRSSSNTRSAEHRPSSDSRRPSLGGG